MTHQKKVDRLIEDLRKRGVSMNTVAPPMFRMLWQMGIQVPPPLFLGFFTLMATMGMFFGGLWGAAMWLLLWRPERMSVAGAILTSTLAGLTFGACTAGYYRWKAARLGLPAWDDYPKTGE